MLLECRLMRTALRGVLTIYERVILLSVLIEKLLVLFLKRLERRSLHA